MGRNNDGCHKMMLLKQKVSISEYKNIYAMDVG